MARLSSAASRDLDGVGAGPDDLRDQLTRAEGLLMAARKATGADRRRGLSRVLRRLADAAAQVEAATETAVLLARADGRSWDSVGASLDTSKQAAWQRFRHLDQHHEEDDQENEEV